jgi:hypothetical protein
VKADASPAITEASSVAEVAGQIAGFWTGVGEVIVEGATGLHGRAHGASGRPVTGAPASPSADHRGGA